MFYDLNPGDKVGLVSPSRFVTKEDIARGVAYLQSLGFEVITAPHAFDKFRFMAGTAEARAEDLMMLYPDVRHLATTSHELAEFTECPSILSHLTVIFTVRKSE